MWRRSPFGPPNLQRSGGDIYGAEVRRPWQGNRAINRQGDSQPNSKMQKKEVKLTAGDGGAKGKG
ncbi:hypothetical protein BEST7613_2355 [Synechocystis sp. PCC 6803]|nr:hypothetical protein BEST7613_2355 [Synechocystis sp. PCC 6803] [Bacillus subtilis BEST7613]